MRISDASHHLKKTALWEPDNQTEAGADLRTPDILNKATTTIRASLGVNAPQDIWSALGLHIQKQLLQQNGVNITNFGTFGFNHNDEPIFVQDPVFLHMTRLCLASRKHGNPVQPVLVESEECIRDIDVNELAEEYLQNCSKDLVKSVISSVLAWVVSWAKDGQQMRLSFLPIGEWICNGDSVDFRFVESFRKEAALRRVQEREIHDSEFIDDNNTEGNSQGDELEVPDDLSAIGALSVFTSVRGKKTNSKTGTKHFKGDPSLATAREDATRNGSPVGRSRYKLRASTFSSKAKQLPPHEYKRNRTDEKTKKAASTTKAKSWNDSVSVHNEKHADSSLFTMNPAQIEGVTKDIIPATKSSRCGSVSSFRTCKSRQSSKTSLRPTAQQVSIINRLRSRMINRKGPAVQGLNALVAVFKTLKTNVISPTQLSLSLRKLGIKISAAEMKEVSAGFGHEKSNLIDTSKLLDALRGEPPSGLRLDMVVRAFHQMGPTCTGAVNIDDMIKHYDVGFLPQVRDGKLSRLEALAAFLQEWASINTAQTNMITFETFGEYYYNVSACIDNDADFARLMQQAWHLDENSPEQENQPPHGPNSSHVLPSSIPEDSCTPGVPSLSPSFQSEIPRNSLEHSTGMSKAPTKETSPNEAWVYLRALLLSPKEGYGKVTSWTTRDDMYRRLSANRVLGDGYETMNVKAFANELSLLDKRLSQKEAYDLAHFVAAHCAESRSESDTIVLQSLHHKLATTLNDTAVTESSMDYNYVEYYASRAIERIRARVAGRSGSSEVDNRLPLDLNALEKWLKLASSNGDSLLLKYELRGGLMKVGIDISYQDLDYIFAYFDVDRQGFISCEAFLDVLRNPLKALPKLVYRQENTEVNSAQKAVNCQADLQQSVQPVVRQKKQAASRELEPHYHRRNLIHRTIWDRTMRPGASEAPGIHGRLDKLEIERRRRYRAAQLIQTIFRGYRAQLIAAQLRRNAAATSYRFATFTQEQDRLLAKKKKINRTALPNTYGF